MAPNLASKALLKGDGAPIDADVDQELWLAIRHESVGASDARMLIKQNGSKRTSFFDLLDQKKLRATDAVFWTFAHGIEREPLIARWIQMNYPTYELSHNRLVYAGDDLRHTATPDMIGPEMLAEIKTSTKPLAQVRSRYFDQLQWQMHVTGYESVLFVVENRASLEKEVEVIMRDQLRIDRLVLAANELLDNI